MTGDVEIRGAMRPRFDEILSAEALRFLAQLHHCFDGERKRLLALRMERQTRFDTGALPDFLPETQHVRDGDWTVGTIPDDIRDRRVEITGPVDRKMIINALNCGARVFMADFEDASSPTWANMVEGQINMVDRWRDRIDFTDPASGKSYALRDDPAVLFIRPRGWHLPEDHLVIDGESISGSLFDFGLYVFHNARRTLEKGSGPYFYLPKMESHLEARLWNDVFVKAQELLGLPRGTIKVTVLIETLPAAFEMDEILYELRDHIVGCNAGRWDYIFSFIKTFRNNDNFVLPDRGQVVMGSAFLRAYSELLIKTCHRRGAFAMGGMAAQIPNRRDPATNAVALAKVRADKEREARAGHDGTWVAHPDLVPVAMEVFDREMPAANQIDRQRDDIEHGQEALLEVHEGEMTLAGLRENIRVGVQYIEGWLQGRGAVPLYNLMEDAATAEISRAQIWQQLNFGCSLADGQKVTVELFEACLAQEMDQIRDEVGGAVFQAGRYEEAAGIFRSLSVAKDFEAFLTMPAYELIK